MTNLVQLIYVSHAVERFSERQLKDLLILSRDANKEHGVTGLLLYNDGNFMQVIEGESAEIDQLYLNITNDPTHTGVTLLIKTYRYKAIFRLVYGIS